MERPRAAKGTDLGRRMRALPQHLLPQKSLSRIAHRLTRSEAPWLKNLLIRAFIAHFGVDMGEAAEPDPRRYPHFNAFFTRALRPGARPLPTRADVLCCPVDGSVSQAGTVDGDAIFQAKGQHYSLTTLLGGEAGRAEGFRGGSFATLYLSPRDYHRIHMPTAGQLRETVHVPGRLFSVSPLTTRLIPGLFARNERLVCLFDTEVGPMALVLVGAVNVASMETVWAGAVTPPFATTTTCRRYPAQGPETVTLERGAEMGRFNMGSTVIVLFAPGAVTWDPSIRADAPVRVGQALAIPQAPARTDARGH